MNIPETIQSMEDARCLGSEEGGDLETPEVRAVEDVHEGDPGVGRVEVPHRAPDRAPHHAAALGPDLLAHGARQPVQERGGELGAQQPETRVVCEGVLVLGQHAHHSLENINI